MIVSHRKSAPVVVVVVTILAVVAGRPVAADDRPPAPKDALGAWGTTVDPDGD
jgi:hypothetical protein